jgi:hypothetical protein
MTAKRPDEIESEIAETRSGLSETLEALEARLAPRQILERGFDMMRDGMDGNMDRIGHVLRENPVPLALIGAGIGWLMLSRTGAGRKLGDAASEVAGTVGDRVRDAAGRAGEYAHAWTKHEETARDTTADIQSAGYGAGQGGSSSTAQRTYGAARDTARDTYERASGMGQRAYGAVADTAGRVGDYAGEAGRQLGHARDRFGQLMEDYPLAVGALGFLAGAVVAASLPSTRWEDEHLGDARDDLWRGAQEAGQEMVEKAKEVASTAASAAGDAAREAVSETAEATKEEAKRQGLTAGENG